MTPNKPLGVQIPPSVISFKTVDQKNNIVKYEGAMFEIFGPSAWTRSTMTDRKTPIRPQAK